MSNGISTGGVGGKREFNTKERVGYIEDAKGELIGGNFGVPKGDFARVLGFRPPTDAERNGQAPISAGRVIELALQKEVAELGERSSKSGMEFRGMYIADKDVEMGGPGRMRHYIETSLDSVDAALPDRMTEILKPGTLGSTSSAQYMKALDVYHEKSREDNMRYLEMQYKFDFANKSFGTVSNLMKVRNEAVRSAVRDAGK